MTSKDIAVGARTSAPMDRDAELAADAAADGSVDAMLMQSIAHGDRRALEALYARHGGLAIALAQRMMGERDLAQDVVQEAFVALWRKAATFDPGRCAPRTWLLAIVRNRCIDELRRQTFNAKCSSVVAQQPPSLDDGPWPETWKRTCGDAVRRALAELPVEQREVVELGFYRGLSHTEIARETGAPLGTVKKRMRSGLKRLRALLDTLYYETSSR